MSALITVGSSLQEKRQIQATIIMWDTLQQPITEEMLYCALHFCDRELSLGHFYQERRKLFHWTVWARGQHEYLLMGSSTLEEDISWAGLKYVLCHWLRFPKRREHKPSECWSATQANVHGDKTYFVKVNDFVNPVCIQVETNSSLGFECCELLLSFVSKVGSMCGGDWEQSSPEKLLLKDEVLPHWA